MHNNLRFSSLVVAALVSWAACAGWMAVTVDHGDSSTRVHSIASVFPTAQAGFAARPSPATN